MKSETEVETPEEDNNESDMTDETVSKTDISKWRKMILAIDNRKLLDFICTTARTRIDIGRADHEVTKKPEKGKNGIGPSYDSYNGPVKMKPIFQVENEDPDKNS